ncbi:MAG: hypothetical protein HY248_01515, partial [Fimbriimonas ginsengisoli]|nr:hypothetical protein [Fimbriimonas ginsengisoli]
RDLWGYLDAREIELLQLDQAKLQVMLDGVHRRLAKLRKDGGLDQERMAGGGALLASQTYRTADGAWVYLGFEVAKNAEGPRVSISYPLAMATAFAVAPEHNANEPLALQRERRLGHGYPTVQAEWSRAGIPGVVDHAVGFKLLTFESLISGTARNVAKLEARYARRASPPAPQPTP